MVKTISELKAQSAEVKNASAIGENTATRVGQLFGDIVEHVEQYENTKDGKDSSQDAQMQSLVSAEESRAKGEERGLQNQIHAEKIDRQTADTYLGNLIQQESSARETADENIRTALANETARAQAAEQELAAAQIYTSKIKDGAVTTPKIADGAVTYEKTDIIAQELGTNMTKVPSQKVVTDAISKEETERKADIDGLTVALGSETINREQADEAESNRAKGEERGLQNQIHAEEIDRKTADTFLSNLIQQETERAMAAEEDNATAIDAAAAKNEEQDQKLSGLEQYLYKRYNAKNIRDNSLQSRVTGVIKENLDYFIVEGIPVFGFENIKIARTVTTSDNGIGIVFYDSNDEMLSGYTTMSEIDVVVPDSAVYANLTINKSVYNSIKQLLFQPYPNFNSRDLDKKITEISYPEFDINNNPISGEFINNIGNTASHDSYKRTDYIELFKGQFLFKLNFGLNLAKNATISFYDENKNFVFSITGPIDSQLSYVEQEVDFSEHPNVRYFRATLYGSNLYAFCKKVDSIIIPTDAVTTAKIADDAVTTAKIADGTIQSTDINPNAFDTTLKTAGKLADAKSVGDAIYDTVYDTIIHEIVQNGQLAVLEGNGIECVTETRSGFINKNGILVEYGSFQTAIINVTNDKAYKIYAPQAGSESVLNRLHLFAEENGSSPICGSYLTKYDSSFYAIFPPEVKSISVTSSTITTLSVLEYDIANSKTFSFFHSKNEELEQTISDVKQTYGEVTDTTTEYESVEGVVLNGKIQVSSAYPDGFHSKPFWCKRGDVITISNRRNSYRFSALYKTDESESYFETLIHGTASQSLVTKECYIQEDGWYGVSGRTSSFEFAKKSISDGYILKATSMDGIKKTIDLTITNDDVVIGDAPVCQFIGSRAYSIKGNSNKTISVSLSETPTGRCFSIGLRIPYATQDVAKVTINGLSYSMASSDERTASGKSYMMEGDHYHRYNFDTRYSEINGFDIVVESEADWEIMLSANCIVDDEMDCCPVMIGYDLTEQYNGYFDYEGESINVYELHKRLNIPYYIAIYKGTVITIQEVQDAIDSGLAEVVFYSGGPAMTPLWNKTDGSFAEKLLQDKCAVGVDVDMNVMSQAVIDRNIYRNLKNAGFKILRHLSQDAGKFSAIADKYGDNDMYISYGYGLGTSSVLPNQLRFPLIMYSHGIGVSNIPNDPYYPSHYVDHDGTKTIETFKYLKSQERIGEVKCLKPSDWFAYIKGT